MLELENKDEKLSADEAELIALLRKHPELKGSIMELLKKRSG